MEFSMMVKYNHQLIFEYYNFSRWGNMKSCEHLSTRNREVEKLAVSTREFLSLVSESLTLITSSSTDDRKNTTNEQVDFLYEWFTRNNFFYPTINNPQSVSQLVKHPFKKPEVLKESISHILAWIITDPDRPYSRTSNDHILTFTQFLEKAVYSPYPLHYQLYLFDRIYVANNRSHYKGHGRYSL